MAFTRTSDLSLSKSGYSFRVVAERDDVSGLGDELLGELQDEAFTNMMAAQEMVVREVRRTLGRSAPRAASPNEPPRKLKGDLQRSWVTGRTRWKNTERTVMEGAVESAHPAAGALEYGGRRSYKRARVGKGAGLTKTGKRKRRTISTLGIRPHPYYRPTLARIADALGALLAGG